MIYTCIVWVDIKILHTEAKIVLNFQIICIAYPVFVYSYKRIIVNLCLLFYDLGMIVKKGTANLECTSRNGNMFYKWQEIYGCEPRRGWPASMVAESAWRGERPCGTAIRSSPWPTTPALASPFASNGWASPALAAHPPSSYNKIDHQKRLWLLFFYHTLCN